MFLPHSIIEVTNHMHFIHRFVLLFLVLLLPQNTKATNTEDSMSNSESFFSKLETRIAEIDSHLCVGLDPHIKELFPAGDGDSKSEEERCDAAFQFCKRIIDATGKKMFDSLHFSVESFDGIV